MGDMFEYDKNACSSTPSLAQTTPPDEISLFLQQIMVRSSSSSLSGSTSSVLAHAGMQTELSSSIGLCRNSNALPDKLRSPTLGDGISTVDCSGAYSMTNIRGDAPYMSSSSMGASETENDEYDCESEEGLETLVEEVPPKPVVGGSSSKRSRAAEVHNQSEKRRRSRINEKMKALQNLIPNSHKTDKASMLDEAIEYLKQLQLQVQMLSMRNGLSLHPMCLPDGVQPIQLSQMRMDFGVGNRPQPLNMTGTPTATQGASTSNLFGSPNQCSVSNQELVSNMSNIINSETSFGLESSIQTHLGPLDPQTGTEEICKEDRLQKQKTNVNHTATHPLEFEVGGTTIMNFDARESNLKGSDSIEACISESNQTESGLLKAIEESLMFPSHRNSMYTGRSTLNDDIKIERPGL